MTTPLLTYCIGALALPNATIELIRTIECLEWLL